MPVVRTSFLEDIAKDKERRYSVSSSVTFCLEMCATSFAAHQRQKHVTCFAERRKKRARRLFARPAHIACIPYETGCKADVDQSSGASVTAFLPSRLISWFEPRLPLQCIDRLCAGRSQAAWRQPGSDAASKETVFLCAQMRTATPCLVLG